MQQERQHLFGGDQGSGSDSDGGDGDRGDAPAPLANPQVAVHPSAARRSPDRVGHHASCSLFPFRGNYRSAQPAGLALGPHHVRGVRGVGFRVDSGEGSEGA